jgi:hypothetical protein
VNIAEALEYALTSPNEVDRNGEVANVVDGLFALARAVDRLAAAVEGPEAVDALAQAEMFKRLLKALDV